MVRASHTSAVLTVSTFKFPGPAPDIQAVTRSPFARCVALAAVLVVAAACSAPTNVTPSTGPWQFSGTVFAIDELKVGAPIAGAQLTLTSNDEVRARTTSDNSGRYVFNALESGRFRLTIAAPGFATLSPNVDLDGDIRADFAMTRE